MEYCYAIPRPQKSAVLKRNSRFLHAFLVSTRYAITKLRCARAQTGGEAFTGCWNLHAGFFEIDPPLSLYLYLPSVFIAKIFSPHRDIALPIYILFFGFGITILLLAP
jgi:hypothetical protein